MPSITKSELIRLRQSDSKLKQLEKEVFAAKFAEELQKAIGTKLAVTSFTEWPKFAKDAFYFVSDAAPTSASIYLSMLPSEKEL